MISVQISTYQTSKTFSSKQNYNNIDNKFELNQYEIELEKQIVSELTENTESSYKYLMIVKTFEIKKNIGKKKYTSFMEKMKD